MTKVEWLIQLAYAVTEEYSIFHVDSIVGPFYLPVVETFENREFSL